GRRPPATERRANPSGPRGFRRDFWCESPVSCFELSSGRSERGTRSGFLSELTRRGLAPFPPCPRRWSPSSRAAPSGTTAGLAPESALRLVEQTASASQRKSLQDIRSGANVRGTQETFCI